MKKKVNIYSPQQARALLRDIEEAKLHKTKSIQKLYRAVLLSRNPLLGQALEKYIEPKLAREQILDFPFNPTSFSYQDHAPEVRLVLGKILQESRELRLLVNHLRMHALILGSPGTGKSVLMEHLIYLLIRCGVKALILERDKVEFRRLLNLIPNLTIFNIEKNFIFNPLQCPSCVNPQHWLVAFVSVFAKYNDLLSGSESLLIRAVNELYQEYGVFEGNGDAFPTIPDLYDKIISYQFKGNRREAGFQDSILNRLYAYISLYKHVYSYSKGIPIEWIEGNNIILECRGVTERIARFQMSIVLYALFMHKIGAHKTTNRIVNATFIDECKWVSEKYNDKKGFTPLTYVMSQSRAVGMGLIFADQTAELEDALFVNSGTKYCFRLGDGKDMKKAAISMGLNARQMQYLTRLKTGECVVRTMEEEEPFVLKVKEPLTE